jgi:hypothetical protein
MRGCRRILILAILLILSNSFYSARAQEEKYIGLFIYNFTKYFDWPESTKNSDFVIQIFGHKTVYDELLRLTAGKKVGTQNIVIQNVMNLQEISRCQIVFVGHWQSRYLGDVITKIGNHPTLLITEMEGMLDKGSAINFVIRDGTIKFEMKAPNVDSHQLKTDQRIRELAYRVID